MNPRSTGVNPWNTGVNSILSSPATLAQSVEQTLRKRQVIGSSPMGGSFDRRKEAWIGKSSNDLWSCGISTSTAQNRGALPSWIIRITRAAQNTPERDSACSTFRLVPVSLAEVLTFAIPWVKFVSMVDNMEESFLITKSWDAVHARIERCG